MAAHGISYLYGPSGFKANEIKIKFTWSEAEKQETELEEHCFWSRVAAQTFLSFSLLSFLPVLFVIIQ